MTNEGGCVVSCNGVCDLVHIGLLFTMCILLAACCCIFRSIPTEYRNRPFKKYLKKLHAQLVPSATMHHTFWNEAHSARRRIEWRFAIVWGVVGAR